MKKKNDKEELVSLNDGLLNEFTMEELEQRLETDPLFMGNLFGDSSSQDGLIRGCCLFGCNNNEVIVD